jgi:hypothetical protein
MEDQKASPDHAPTTTDGQGNPALAAFNAALPDEAFEAIGRAVEAANVGRDIGLYDYTGYPGEGPPYVVRDYRLTGNNRVFESRNAEEARARYDSLAAQYVGRVAVNALLKALRDGASSRPPVTSDAVPRH